MSVELFNEASEIFGGEDEVSAAVKMVFVIGTVV